MRKASPGRRLATMTVAIVVLVLAGLGTGPVHAASGAGKDPGPPPEHGQAASPIASPAAKSALTATQARVADYVAKHGTRYSFAVHLDPGTATIVLETDAPASVVSMVTDPSGGPAAQVQVLHSAARDVFHRRDDTPPFWGGGGIKSVDDTLCSSGYAVARATTRFMVTAGHCYANGQTVYTESGGHVYGVVSDRQLSPIDVELIGGQSYAGRVFTGGALSTTSAPVVAAGSAVVGYSDYCHSARDGEFCGHTATDVDAMVCTATGCKVPVIRFVGGVMPGPGDSGGAFYAKDSVGGIWIRGHILAIGGGAGYAVPWTRVASSLGVTIVTG